MANRGSYYAAAATTAIAAILHLILALNYFLIMAIINHSSFLYEDRL
ncbi:MAG TPA: hypothetical protein VKA95_09985 [Nitrososphaeraceae archaeon]|nr:hypothetical protein [Nitrososphaeraceae archaeon]